MASYENTVDNERNTFNYFLIEKCRTPSPPPLFKDRFEKSKGVSLTPSSLKTSPRSDLLLSRSRSPKRRSRSLSSNSSTSHEQECSSSQARKRGHKTENRYNEETPTRRKSRSRSRSKGRRSSSEQKHFTESQTPKVKKTENTDNFPIPEGSKYMILMIVQLYCNCLISTL